MHSKRNLVLLGMMGSGKSTIGLMISKRLKLKFIDIDKLIEIEANMAISDIFEKKGESFFRLLEKKITLDNLDASNNVISLGGGGFINNEIRKKVLKNSCSFWLNWDSSIILDRINKSKKRPLSFNLEDNEINKLISNRSKIYSKAKHKINCNKLSKNEIINKIIKFYEFN